MIQALTKYRPTKTTDGEGGFTDTLGTGATFYGALAQNDVRLLLVYTTGQDVVPEDVIETPGGERYRVRTTLGELGANSAQAELERIARPVDA